MITLDVRSVRAWEIVRQHGLVIRWIGQTCFVDDRFGQPLSENTDPITAVLAADAELRKQEQTHDHSDRQAN